MSFEPKQKTSDDSLASTAKSSLPSIKEKEELVIEIVDDETSDYADGALRAWSTVAGAFLLQFYAVGVVTAFGVFQDYYTTTWLNNYSASAISWIGGVQYFFELGCAPVGGKLFDAGYFRSSVVSGSLLSSFSFFMLSLTKQNQYYQVFLTQSVGMGVGLSLVYLPTMTVVSQHFRKHRALAMGIVTASAPLGAIVFSITLNHLFNSHIGFAWGVRAVGFITLGCFVLGNMLMFVPPKPVQPPATPAQSSLTLPLKPPLFDTPYVLILISAFLLSLGSNTPTFYIQLFAQTKGVKKSVTFNTLAIMNAGSIFGRIAPSWFADKVGAMNVYIPLLASVGLVQFAMLGANSPAGVVLFSLFYGFMFGSVIALYLPMIADISLRGTDMGKRMGIALAPIGIASLIGPPIAGAILGPDYLWWRPIVFSAVIVVVASGFNIAARQIHRRRTRIQSGAV